MIGLMQRRAAGVTTGRSTPSTGNPYLFIVGCPRSGTTLLQRIVDAHPLIAMTPETQWVARWCNRKGLTSGGCVNRACDVSGGRFLEDADQIVAIRGVSVLEKIA